MDSKKFVTLILFILTYEVLNKDTRYVLMALMECQNLFKQETTFKIYPSFLKVKFDISTEKLSHILDYLNKAGWITLNCIENYYEVTVNYEKIENVRTAVINYNRSKKC